MLTAHSYKLQRYNGPASRHRCPACNKNRTFTLYVNAATQQPIHSTVGRCDRLINCGYHYPPKQYFADNRTLTHNKSVKAFTRKKYVLPLAPSYMDEGLVAKSFYNPERNNLIMFLADCLGANQAEQLANTYGVGRSNHWPGATVFWQTDITGKIRAGKIMLYNRHTGKRVKEPFNHINWVHKVLNMPDYNLQQCFFGEHLLHGNQLPVAIVESEKTAMIASFYYPGFIWLACGGLGNLTAVSCRVLQFRKVMLVPDLNAYQAWLQKASSLQIIENLTVSDMLQTITSLQDKQQGLDLADYLIRYDHTQLRA